MLDPQLVTHDTALTLDAHVKSLVCSCFYHLKNIAKLSPIVSRSEMDMIIHAFISSCLDCCNSIFTGRGKKSLECLQVIQNATNKIFQVLSCQSVANSAALAPRPLQRPFQNFILTFRALHGPAPTYIRELLQPHGPSKSLRSCDQGLLAVQHTVEN